MAGGMTEKILIIDDEEANRLLLAKLLEWRGFDTVCGASAEEGLRLVQEQTRQEIITQQGIAARQNEISLRMEEIQNRQFQVSSDTYKLLDAHLANQTSLQEEQVSGQGRVVSELERMNRGLRSLGSSIERKLSRPITVLEGGRR